MMTDKLLTLVPLCPVVHVVKGKLYFYTLQRVLDMVQKFQNYYLCKPSFFVIEHLIDRQSILSLYRISSEIV